MPGDAPPRPWPATVEAVLFDAGGVLLDLDYRYLHRLIETPGETRPGPPIDVARLAELEAIARREIHRHVESGGRTGDAWRDYFHHILGRAGVPAAEQDGIIDSLWEAHQRFGLWTVAIDGGPETVAELKRRGYRLGVVSNAEGRVARDLDSAGYAGVFDVVVDSHVVGVEKPDPGIFEIALSRMSARAERTVFVGDVPAVDVVGARAAGLTPILVDRHGLYPEVDAHHVTAVGDLLQHLG